MSRESTPPSNRDFAWDEFDPEAYVAHYYADPHPDDDRVAVLASQAIKSAQPRDRPIDIVDVGTCLNLFPLLASLPRCAKLTAWEVSQSNIAWLEAELDRTAMRPPWHHFWGIVREAYGPDHKLPNDPMSTLQRRTDIRKGSIFDLPERTWDAATMFFCAESITRRPEEFEQACARFARCVRPGGTLVAAFLLGSASYEIAGRGYPVVTLSESSLRQTFSCLAKGVSIEKIGIVEEEVRSGYTGMAFVTARSL